MKRTLSFPTVLAAVILVPSVAAQEVSAGQAGDAGRPHVTVAAEEIQWQPVLPLLPPGAEFAVLEGDPMQAGQFTTRLRLPAGYRIPPHTHPVDARITVLTGRMGGGIGREWDDSKMRTLGPGGYFVLPSGTAHFEMAVEESIVQLNATGPWATTYVDPADDPRNAPPTANPSSP